MSVIPRPYVILSGAMSQDGCINDLNPSRLILSNAQDWKQVHELRAQCDAVLVGAETIRKDDPSLVTKSEKLRQQRLRKGKKVDPIKITFTSSGRLKDSSRFFIKGSNDKWVYAPKEVALRLRKKLKNFAQVIDVSGKKVSLLPMLKHMRRQGVRSLLVEGGTSVNSAFLKEGFVEEVRLAIAPFHVNQPKAPKWVNGNHFPPLKKCKRFKIETCGDMTVLHMKFTNRRLPR